MRKLLFILFVSISVFFLNCKKETQAQIVTVRDTVYVEVRDTTVIPALISDTTTTFIVLRHAEKETIGADPNLNSDGLLRAEELKRILGGVSVNAIYSTSFNRTKQTVQPLAAAKGLSVTEYPTEKQYPDLVNDILSANRGKTVVIVGHSNTVPGILKALSNNAFSITMNEAQYDNIFIVSMPEKLKPTVTALKFGKETP